MSKEREEDNAAKWSMFDQTLAEARAEFADLAPEDVQDLINEATDAVRLDQRASLARRYGITES